MHQCADILYVFCVTLKQAAQWALRIGVTFEVGSPPVKAEVKLPCGFDHLKVEISQLEEESHAMSTEIPWVVGLRMHSQHLLIGFSLL